MLSSLPQRTAAFLLAGLCAVACCQNSRSTPPASSSDVLSPADEADLQQALAAYDRGESARATPVLLNLAKQHPGAAQVQEAAGIALAEAGNVTEAATLLERAHDLAPADPGIARNLAAALIGAGKPAQAVSLLQASSLEKAADPQHNLLLAQAQIALHRFHDAALSFQAAAALFSSNSLPLPPGFRHDWAVALLADHKPAEAAALLAPSDADPDPADLPLRAEAKEQAGDFTGAAADLKLAVERDPSEANLTLYGDELLRHLTFPAAIRIFEYGVARYPQSSRLRLALGIALFGNGSFSQAAQVLLTQLRQTPDDARVADLLGRSCAAELDKADPSCEALLPFAKAHPGNAPASLYAAIVLAHRPGANPSAQTAASQLLLSAVQADPKLADAWYQLGSLQQTAGDWTGSIDSLQKAVALRPSYAEAHYRLSRAYAHLSRQPEARAEIALQQRYAREASDEEKRRMQEVMTFLVTNN